MQGIVWRDPGLFRDTPGRKKRSRVMGRGLAMGKGLGPVGIPIGGKRPLRSQGMPHGGWRFPEGIV